MNILINGDRKVDKLLYSGDGVSLRDIYDCEYAEVELKDRNSNNNSIDYEFVSEIMSSLYGFKIDNISKFELVKVKAPCGNVVPYSDEYSKLCKINKKFFEKDKIKVFPACNFSFSESMVEHQKYIFEFKAMITQDSRYVRTMFETPFVVMWVNPVKKEISVAIICPDAKKRDTFGNTKSWLSIDDFMKKYPVDYEIIHESVSRTWNLLNEYGYTIKLLNNDNKVIESDLKEFSGPKRS